MGRTGESGGLWINGLDQQKVQIFRKGFTVGFSETSHLIL